MVTLSDNDRVLWFYLWLVFPPTLSHW